MFKRMAGGFRRAAALMMSVFIILSQLALPVAALAQDVTALPSLNLYYLVGENTMGVNAQATLYAQQPVYWATVPAEALQSGVTLEIVPTGVEGESYNSAYGFQLMAQDASAVDGTMVATYIEVYSNGALTGSYPLYISTQPLPPEQPAYFDPVPVQVNYYDQNNSLIGGYADSVGMEGKTFYAENIDGYELTSASEVTVTMDGNGNLSQYTVDFYYARKSFDPVGVQVNFYDENNQLLDSYTDSVGMEGKTFYAESIDGYELTSASEVTVTMDSNGNLSQYSVDFYYAKKSFDPVPVEVRFIDQDGNVLNSYTQEVGMDGYVFYADSFDGYELTSAGEVSVTMDGNGSLSQTVVEFYYARKSFDPVPVQVNYYDQDNVIIGGYADSVGMEGKTFYAESIDGYELTSASEVTVTMDSNGNLSQYSVDFYYAKKSFDPVPVEVRFIDQDGNLLNSYTHEVGMDGYTFYADAFDGYELTSAAEVTVTMDGNGALSQSVVEFHYAKKTFDAVSVEIRYIDQDGSVISGYADSVGMEGKTFYAGTIDGYTLTSAGEVTVTMDENGNLSQTVIEFYYVKNAEPEQPVEPEQPEEPKYATITMKVVDSANWDNVFYTNTADYGEGAHTFTPSSEYLPENYTLDTTDGLTVNVYADGSADTYEVVFTATYHEPVQPEPPVEPEQPEEPKYATITMKIVDSANWDNVLYTHTDTYGEGAHAFMPSSENLPENYTLDATDGLTVNVYADGSADTYEVVFTATYTAPVQPEPEQPIEPEQPVEPEPPVEPEQPVEPEPPETGLPEGVTLIETLSCEGETTKGSLRFRSTPTTSTDANIVFKGISKGVIVQVTSSVQNASGELWYGIIHEGTACYVKGDCLQLIEKEPASEKITFLYHDVNGNQIMDPQEATFAEGSHPTAPYFKEAPEGYTYSGVNTDTIIVDANGASTLTVIFTYAAVEQKPVVVDFTFEYMCEGQYIIDPVVQPLGVGSYPVSDFVREFEGYTFTGASHETLVVYEDGTSSSTSVLFDYNRNPVYADVTIRHQLADGSDVPGLSAETRTLEKNTYSVQDFIQYAEGYSFQSASAETIVVDENGANPAEVILTYQKNLVQAQVTIHVQDTEGNSIPGMDSQSVILGEGAHAVSTLAPVEPQGYAYSHASAEQITVTAAGADPEVITFYYQKLPVEAQVTFRFVDERGNAVPGLESYTATLGANTYDTAAYAIAAPAGYQYSGASAAQIVVDENGASPAEVFYYYTKLPESVTIPVYHQDADGKPLMDATSLTFSANDFGRTVTVLDVLSITAPEGYVYAGVNSDTITIDQRGGVTPEAIQVTYVVRPKAQADVTFYYLCDGQNVADPQTVKLSEGAWDTNEYAVKLDGYDLVSASAAEVTIGEDGTASPAEVNFIYKKRITTANLTVHYRNSFGEELPGSPEIRPLEKGQHTITPNAAYVPAGYVLSANTQVFEVTVNDDLTLSTPSVSFNYYDANLTGTVTVNYYDTESGTTFATEEVKLTPGTHELKPNEELVRSKGNYEVSDILTNTLVKVDEKGVATPSAVVFYYKPATYQGYQGYLLVTEQTAIRKEAAAGGAVISLISKDTVLWSGFQYQSGATEWFDAQTMTGESYRGWVDGAHVRKISAEEAQIRIEEAKQPEELEQNPGYYITIMNNVPLRQYKNTASQAKYLNVNTVVQVSGQEYDDSGDYVWHAATYYDYDNKVKYSGYIRDGQLRKLTQEEVDEYLSANDPIDPDDSTGSDPYDPNGASSYGYVTKDSVNFRSEPGGTRLKMLNKYGMALIIGTREVNGVTWYNVNYSGQVGWIHGDYFHQMTLTEFTSFMGSEAYYQGITNNTVTSSGSSSTKPSTGSTGSATQGNVSSVEDWNVGVWQNTGVTNTTTYQPFNPYATPVATTNPKGDYLTTTADVKFYQMASENSTAVTLPKDAQITIAGTVTANGKTWYQVTYDGRNGYVDASAVLDKLGATPTPEPTSTFVIGTMIPITYEDQSTETQTGTVPWGLIGGAIVLVGGAGGVYAYALNQNKKRKAAAARAAASRRAAAANAAAAGATSPYARRAVAAAPGGQQQRAAQQAQQRPVQPNAQNQYARPASDQQPMNTAQQQTQASPYARPAAAQQTASPAQPQQAANPYARPAQPAPIVNPYAAAAGTASAADQAKPAQQTANPYARPIAPVSQQAQAASQPAESASAATPRRTRMQRYHDASNGGTSTDA